MVMQHQAKARPRPLAVKFGGLAFLFCLGLGIGFLDDGLVARIAEDSPLAWIVGSAAVVALATAVSAAWMNGIDELAQRAHYVAWFWGGSIGLAMLLFVLLGGPGLARVIDLRGFFSPLTDTYGDQGGFMAGVMASIVALTLGYSAWWIVFWLRKR